MFPTMYNSDILVELTSPNEDTGPLNKDRLKLQRKALKFARRYFRDFLIYLNNCLYLTEQQKSIIYLKNWSVEEGKCVGPWL